MRRSCHRCCCRPAKMEPNARHLLPTLGVAYCRKSKDLLGQKLVGQAVLWPCDCLTPELSRAAKRRRLGRIVRTDVTAEAAEPQAATPRTKREPLTESRATRRPRLEKPKPERRPTEARTLVSERATASTARRNNTRARTRRSTHARGGGAPALSEAMRPKREAQRANHRPTATRQDARNAGRDATTEAQSTGKLFPRPNALS